MTNVRKNSAKLTREDLKIAPESPTMELSETPAVEPSDQTSKTVRHAPLVYRVEEIAQLLAISNRAAYNLCNTTKGRSAAARKYAAVNPTASTR